MVTMKIRFDMVDMVGDVNRFVKIASNIPENIELVSGYTVANAKSVVSIFRLYIGSPLILRIYTEDEDRGRELRAMFSKYRIN